MALIRCPECGQEISDQAKSCPYCGYPICSDTSSSEPKEKSFNYGDPSSDPKKKKNNSTGKSGKETNGKKKGSCLRTIGYFLIIVIILFVIFLIIGIVSDNESSESDTSDRTIAATSTEKNVNGTELMAEETETEETETEETEAEEIETEETETKESETEETEAEESETEETQAEEAETEGPITEEAGPVTMESEFETEQTEKVTEASHIDWIQYYTDMGIEVLAVDADILFQYSEYFSGSTIYTAFVVDSKSSSDLKAHLESDTRTYVYSIVCSFDDRSEIDSVQEGDTVAVIGSASGNKTVNMSDCHLIASGDEAVERMNELASNTDAQINHALSIKAARESEQEEQEALAAAEQAQQDAEEKQSFVNECVTVDYTDVERNPDSYKDTKIVVSGEVIQVSEGWFDSVTMRVQQTDGNIWYVTYTRSDGESRILEGDYITLYGTCNGVTSYTNILGGTVTIPSVKAQYIN